MGYKMKKNGFTLIEISVVLLISGLLFFTVIKGSSLIEYARLHRLMQDMRKVWSDINFFYTEYHYYPGDMPNASDFFDSSKCGGVRKINGNGDGRIEFKDRRDGGIESYLAWCHLSQAGLGYQSGGGPDSTSAVPVLGVDIPTSKIKGSGFLLSHGVHGFEGNNVLVIGAPRENMGRELNVGPILTARQAYLIDKKMDDGNPTTGNVRGINVKGSKEPCFIGDAYNIKSKEVNCALAMALE